MDEDKFSSLVMDNVDMLCYVSDLENYDLLYINKIAKKRLGLENVDINGKKCYEVLQGKTEKCSFCTNDKLVKGQTYNWEFHNPIINRYFSLNDSIVEFDGKDVRLEYAIDITEDKNKITKLTSQLTFEETLVKCAQALSDYKDINSAINHLLGIICEFFAGDRSYIFEYCDDKVYMDNTYEWNNDNIEPQIDNLQNIPVEVCALWFEKFEKEGEFFINSLSQDVEVGSDVYNILQPQGIESLMAAPLVIDDKCFGFLGIDNPKVNTLDTTLLRSVTLFVTAELEKKQINKKLEKISFIDAFTGVYNRNKYMSVVDEISLGKYPTVGIVYLDIDELKKSNDEYGHEYGDMIILKFVSLVKKHLTFDIFRIGGDEFVGIYIGDDKSFFEDSINKLKMAIQSQEIVNAAQGSAWCEDTTKVLNYILEADKLMYEYKQNYYKVKSKKPLRVKYSRLVEEHEESDDIYYQADLLTGCLDKESTISLVKYIIDESSEIDEHVFILIDLNNFSLVNKHLGHLAGDNILKQIGIDLRKLVRTGDIVGRIKGDQFVVFIKNTANMLSVKHKLDEILFVIKSNLDSNRGDIEVTVSVGVSRFRVDGDTYQELYKNALSALNLAHKKGESQYCIYSKIISRKDFIIQNKTSKTIDNDSKQYPTKNLLTKVFELLLMTNNIPEAISEVIALIGVYYNVSRVYIFELVEDETYYRNTYEWCANGISAEINNLQNIPKDKYMYMASFGGESGILACNDLSEISGVFKDLLESQGVMSFLQVFSKTNGIPRILVGVDECVNRRIWQEDEIFSMTYITNLLSMASAKTENIQLLKDFEYMKKSVDLDSLTGIPTKEKFYKETCKMLKENPDKKFVFVLLNINKFQMINSFFGMEEGDRLLQLIANEFSILSQNSLSTYGRMGADIFYICQELDGTIENTANNTTEIINLSILNYRFDYNLSASIGVYFIQDYDMPIEMMHSKALIAAKKIKHLKVTEYSIYDDNMEDDEINEQSLTNELIPGLIKHQFEVYLQPKVDLLTLKIIGAEALVRWNHPTKGMISPAEFVPLFEKNGLITKVDYFVWESVFQYIQNYQVTGEKCVPISVNLSRVELLNVNLISCFEEFLKKYDVLPELVHLEITESAYVINYNEIGEVINQLRNLGFHIEMDDFGSGYSSLNMFNKMHVDTLKLDMIFLKDLNENAGNYDILTFIIRLAKNFNLKVVAEGVETFEQFEFLKDLGCDIGQGYYFSKPMPMDKFENYIKSFQTANYEVADLSNDSMINLQDILYLNYSTNKFFENGLIASAIFIYSHDDIKTIRCNNDFHNLIGANDCLYIYKNNLQLIIHKDDISLLKEMANETKNKKETVSFDIRIMDVRDVEKCKYILFHACLKIINKAKKSDVFIATFEKKL